MAVRPVDFKVLKVCGSITRAGVGLGTVLASGCRISVLNPAGPVAAAERIMLLDALAIMLAIVVPTIVVAVAFAWWFRASNTRARYRPEWTYSGRVELLVWSIPTLVIFFLGGVIWIGSHALDPARPLRSDSAPLEVQVVSLDWKWLFIYPAQGIASVNELVVPAGVPVHFSLTSASVMNVFFVPQLGSMIYTMHGMVTQLNLQADRAGDFFGESAHFSGDGFSDMHFLLRAQPAQSFAAWVRTTREKGLHLDGAAYIGLAAQSSHVAPFTYSSVESGLFQTIVMQRLPPGPGPQEGRGGVAVHAETSAVSASHAR
jgi:cytochrome o ubiquinol oxidase subunit II